MAALRAKPVGLQPISEGFAMQDAVSALMNLGYPQETDWQALRRVQLVDPAKATEMRGTS